MVSTYTLTPPPEYSTLTFDDTHDESLILTRCNINNINTNTTTRHFMGVFSSSGPIVFFFWEGVGAFLVS